MNEVQEKVGRGHGKKGECVESREVQGGLVRRCESHISDFGVVLGRSCNGQFKVIQPWSDDFELFQTGETCNERSQGVLETP